MSKTALSQIQVAKLNHLPLLVLSNCNLNGLPRELLDLKWLKILILSDEAAYYDYAKFKWMFYGDGYGRESNKIDFLPKAFEKLQELQILSICGDWSDVWGLSDISVLKNLKKLQQVYLSATKVYDLSPLAALQSITILEIASTDVIDLTPLKKLINLERLDIQNTAISDISHLESLNQLHYLNLSNTKIKNIYALKKITSLYYIDASKTRINDLSPVENMHKLYGLYFSNTKITHINSLKNLINLEELDISNTLVTDLHVLSKLPLLTKLDISRLKIDHLLPLEGLKNLKMLDFSETQVRDMVPLANLIKLEQLYISGTQIADLSPLKKHTNLQLLDISYTQVSDLSPLKDIIEKGIAVKWSSTTYEGNGIYLKGCPITNPPIEIAMQGNESILSYWEQLKTQGGGEELYEAKMIIVGEGGTGKTTLYKKMIDSAHQVGNTPETHGINIYEGLPIQHDSIGEHTFYANLWDFGGQELQYMTHQFFLTPNALYVLMMDTRSESPNLPYWFKIISLLGKDKNRNEKVKLILVSNKRKGSTGKIPQYQDILKYYEDTVDAQFVELDLAETGAEWLGLKEKIESALVSLPIVKSQLPKLWNPIREALREEAKTHNYISTTRLHEICLPYQVENESDLFLLSRYLHQLGSLLHFQDDEDLVDTVILKPEWVVEGVYTLLKSEDIKHQNGKFTAEELFAILGAKHYTKADSLKILKLMSRNNFDICYKSAEGTYVAAQLLPDNHPKQYKWFTQFGALQFRYQYPIMPKGLMSRLIVRLSEYIEVIDRVEVVWKKGAILWIVRDSSECRILIREDDAESPTGLRQIIIEVMGDSYERKFALRRIRDEVDAIHKKWFRNIKADELVPCCCEEACKLSSQPYLHKLEKLLNLRYNRFKITAECGESGADVPIDLMLNGVYDKSEIKNFERASVKNSDK